MADEEKRALETSTASGTIRPFSEGQPPIEGPNELKTELTVGNSEKDHGSDDPEEEEEDLWKPLKMEADIPYEENPLTIRAVVVGCILGSLVAASNLYLGERSCLLFSRRVG